MARLLPENGERHFTAEQWHGEALAEGIRVSLATVYNTLHQFTDSGLLHEVIVEPGRSFFDTNTDDHHHFFCEATGQLQDIPGGIANSDWAYADCTSTPFPGSPNPQKVCLKNGFDTNHIYELIYTAKDPIIMGLGLAAIPILQTFSAMQKRTTTGIPTRWPET